MFDYTNNARNRQTTVCTKELFKDVLHFTSVASICADIKDAHEKVLRGEMSREDFETYKRQEKIKLPAFLFQAHFKDNIRHNTSAIPSGLSILDIDHIEAPKALSQPSPQPGGGVITGQATDNQSVSDILKGHLLKEEPITDKKTIEKLKSFGIVLVHITPSCEGLRLVFKLQQGESLVEGQKRMANALGLKEFDEVCKDLARCSFAVPEEYVLYVDEEGLWAPPISLPHPGEGEITETSKPSVPNTESSPSLFNKAPVKADTSTPPLDGGGAGEGPLKIFDMAVASSGLTLDNLNNIGTRHNSLITILSLGICRLMKREQMEAIIAERMPDYAKEKDCQDLIRDFYTKYTDPSRPMSIRLRKIFTDSLKVRAQGKLGGDNETQEGISLLDVLNIDEPTPEEVRMQDLVKNVMNSLPFGLRESLDGVPENMKMPVLCSLLPIAATYADGVTVEYADNTDMQLGLMAIIIGPQASGKSVCTRKIALWQRQMKEDDKRAREIEDKYKEECRRTKKGEQLPENPHVFIRSIPATVSCSTLLKRMKNAHEHAIWTFCPELDTLVKSNGAGSWSAKYDVYRFAFDRDLWGQDYNSDQAESGEVNVAYNFTILGTYGALRRCFDKNDNVENGLSSRILLAEMPDNSFTLLPHFGKVKHESVEAIDKAVALLSSKKGRVDTPRLRLAIENWVNDACYDALADADTVRDVYRRRAAVIGFRCGVVAMLLEGQESDKVVTFATSMAQYVLYEQDKLFGEKMEAALNNSSHFSKRVSENKNAFDSLPGLFTIEDVQRAKGMSLGVSSLRMVISRWKKTGWIEKAGKNQWRKIGVAS